MTTHQEHREILFRAYNKKDHDWLRDDRTKEIAYFQPINTLANICNPKDLVIQQYTGVKDKNGIMLFEGDLVTYKWERYEHDIEESTGEIYFDEGIFYFGKADEFAMNDCNFLTSTIEWVAIRVDLT